MYTCGEGKSEHTTVYVCMYVCMYVLYVRM